jgi:hypothetical protein
MGRNALLLLISAGVDSWSIGDGQDGACIELGEASGASLKVSRCVEKRSRGLAQRASSVLMAGEGAENRT